MIPKNNKEKFVKKYGNWWFLRDLDFLVENLADCGYNMTYERMDVVFDGKLWAVYDDYDEAVEASKKVRKVLGLPEAKYAPEEYRTYKF